MSSSAIELAGAEAISRYEPVIGLEVHVQLATATKIFCGCPTSFGAPPNTNVCPVCLGLPGALPVLSRQAVELAIEGALALNCPDNPSVFASSPAKIISIPTCPRATRFRSTTSRSPSTARSTLRWTARSAHRRHARPHGRRCGQELHEGFRDSDRYTYVDLNRCGTPLIEIVSEPDMRSSDEAYAYLTYLKQALQLHGIFAGEPDPPDFSRRGNPTHRILAFGKWGTYKRLELLIEAFEHLAKKFPDVELVIGGGDHPKTPGYVQSMADRHACDRIRFLGYVPEADIPDLFRDASLTVMPYTSSAGSSGVAHLAAQYGVPVVASGIQDFRDLAEHEGIAIRFFEPGSVDSLVDEMFVALNSPEELEKMAWQSYSAGVAMSMPQVVREYIRSFRRQERVKTLQLAAGLRRSGRFHRPDELARTVGERIQKWQDEDELATPPA